MIFQNQINDSACKKTGLFATRPINAEMYRANKIKKYDTNWLESIETEYRFQV